MTPEEANAILIERARRLAQPLVQAEQRETWTVAIFELAGERYAIEVRFVREIARLVDLTPVPGAPAHLFGLTNLRGEILPAFDLRRLVGLTGRGLTDLSRLIVLGGDRNELALLADEARDVATLSAEDVFDPPGSASIGGEYLRGVTRDALIVLDGAALLRDPRFFIDQTEAIRREG